MKNLTWVDITRKSIKSKLGFSWSVQGIEKQNKVKTKVVYRFSTGQRTTVLTDLDWHAENNNEITNLVVELSDLMNERSVDLVKAYQLMNGGKLNKNGKKEIIEKLITLCATIMDSASWIHDHCDRSKNKKKTYS